MGTGWRNGWAGRIGRRTIVVGALVALMIVAWIILPGAGLRWGLIKTLRDLGMVEVTVADTALSLFKGHLVVRDMVARPQDGSALGIGDFTLNFRWGPLFDKRVAIDRVALTGGTIDLRRDPGSDVFVLNGLPLMLSGGDAPPPSDQAKTGRKWGIDIGELDLTNSRLRISDGPVIADIAIHRLLVSNLHSRQPDRPVTFHLDGDLNGAAVTIDGTVLPFADQPSFTLSLAANGLDLKREAAALARLGLSGPAGRLDLQIAAEGRLDDHGPSVSGSGRAEIAAAHLGAPVGLAANRLSLAVTRAVWTGGTLDLAGQVEANGLKVTAAPASLAASDLTVAANRLAWADDRIEIDGTARAKGLAASWPGGRTDLATVTLTAAPLTRTGGRIDWQGDLDLTEASTKLPDLDVTGGDLRWTGRIGADPTFADIRAEGGLTVRTVQASLADLVIGIARAEASGRLATATGTAMPVSAEQIRLNGEAITVSARTGGRDWGSLDRIEVDGLGVTPSGAISATRLDGTGLAALRQTGGNGHSWRVETKTARIERLDIGADRTIAAALARLGGLTVRLSRDGDGMVGFSFPPSPAGKSASPPLHLAIERVSVTDDSRLVFEDRTLAEPVRLVVRPIELTATALDSARPRQPSPVDLAATIGNARLVAKGALTPFAAEPGGTLSAQITALELPPLSPYLADALGVNLRTGHFDGILSGAVTAGTLDGSINLTLSNLRIAAPDPASPLARSAGMPVETMLDLLRDGEGRIRLEIPVRGRLDAPDFDLSDAIGQAIAGAMKSTVLATLKVAFPLTALISLVTEGEDGGHLALAPLAFAPGEDALGDEHYEILDKVAQLLSNRPGLSLTLCGKANTAEWPILAARRRAADRPILSRLERLVGHDPDPEAAGPPDRDLLGRLAERRAAAAKTYLAQTGAIAPGRLFTCRGEIEAPEGKGPRVDLIL